MKGINCCSECIFYDFNRHRCFRGAHEYTDPKSPFFADCPLENVEPVRPKGHWTTKITLTHDGEPYCSECDETPYRRNDIELPKFCPNCGADMRGNLNA